MRRLNRLIILLAGLATAAGLLAARMTVPAPFHALQLDVYDAYQRWDPYVGGDLPVLVVDIDDAGLQQLGQWPWPRDLVAQMVDRLHGFGAAAIALDILLSEPDRTSPAQLAEDPVLADLIRDPAALPDHDAILADSFAAGGRVVTAFTLLPSGGRDAAPIQHFSWAMIGPPPGRLLTRPQVLTALDPLQRAAAGNGAITQIGGAGGMVRRVPLLLRQAPAGTDQPPVLLPSLSMEALRVAFGAGTLALRGQGDGPTAQSLEARVGQVRVPLPADAQIWVHHGPWPAARRLSVADVMTAEPGDAVAQLLTGRIVFVGSSAAGLADLRATPLNPLEPGVNLHARLAEQMLAGHYLDRPDWGTGAEWMAALAVGGLVALLVALAGPISAAVVTLLVAVGAVAGGAWAFADHRLLLDPVPLVAVPVLVLFACALIRFRITERDRRQVRDAFAHYLSPDLVNQLTRDPASLRLGGESRDMTFLFTDLEGFTSLTEAIPPTELVSVLNAYLDGICGVVMDHGGTIDKLVGDAVVAMFNAPLDQPDHPERAVRCALAIDAFAEAFRVQQQAAGLPFGRTRVGVNTGPAVVGNFGGNRRFDYTAHGDAINTAARLESANKDLGTRICVSASAAERCPGIRFQARGTLQLRGKQQHTDVFEPLGEASAEAVQPA